VVLYSKSWGKGVHACYYGDKGILVIEPE